MRISQLSFLVLLPILMIHIYAILNRQPELAHLSEVLIFFPLIIGFYNKLEFSNQNISSFLFICFLAAMMNFYDNKFAHLAVMFCWMIAYFFLYREAIRYTQRKMANRYMKFFFLALLLLNIYFLSGHLEEIERKVSSEMEFGFYGIYYLNLLVLAVVGLVYYLNSYSKKSVYFISLIIALLFADVFRDMATFYLQDTSVQMIQALLHSGGIILAFKFFVTPERKLRLINLL